MRKSLLLCTCLSLILAVGCRKEVSTEVRTPVDYGELQGLEVDHAVEDAQKAMRAGDFRVLGMYGFALDLPGVPLDKPDDMRTIRSTYGIRILRGSTDTPGDEKHEALLQSAYQYAEKYNHTILTEHKVALLN